MLRCGTTVGVSFVDAWFMSNHRWRWGVLGVCGLAVLVYLRSDWLRYFHYFHCLNMLYVFSLYSLTVSQLLRWLWFIRSSLTCCGIFLFLMYFSQLRIFPWFPSYTDSATSLECLICFCSKIHVSETFINLHVQLGLWRTESKLPCAWKQETPLSKNYWLWNIDGLRIDCSKVMYLCYLPINFQPTGTFSILTRIR